MREILFRGKDVISGEWVYGDLAQEKHTDNSIKCAIVQTLSTYEVTPSTVGQYTGLVDKNSKQLFDGDIVRVAEYDNMLMREFTEDGSRFEIFDIEEAKGGLIRSYTTAISWEEGAFVFSSNGEYNDTLLTCLFGDMRRSYPIFEIEIVGNIYDNPDLLKGENKDAKEALFD